MLNILRKRLTATLSASQPGLPGSASLVRVLCSRQSGASDQDAKPLRWASLLGLTGASKSEPFGTEREIMTQGLQKEVLCFLTVMDGRRRHLANSFVSRVDSFVQVH